eukprot:tig00000269_g23716.t1
MTQGRLSSSLVATAAPSKPLITQGVAASTATSVSVKISLPSDGSAALYNGTEVYRNGTLVATLQKNVLNWTSTGLQPGTLYSFHAVLTTNETRVRAVSDPSDSLDLWTALLTPTLVLINTSTQPSVTIQASPLAQFASLVVATRCKRDAGAYSAIAGGYLVDAQVVYATTYTYSCVLDGRGGTTSEPGSLNVTTLPSPPVLALVVLNSTSLQISVSATDSATAGLWITSTIVCNGTAYTVARASPQAIATGLLSATAYACHGRLNSSVGSSAWSAAYTVTLPPAKSALSLAPLNATALQATVTISDAASAALTNGTEIVCNGSVGTVRRPRGELVIDLASLLPGTAYQCQARLLSPAGPSEFSVAAMNATQLAPKPTLSLADVSNDTVSLRVQVPVTAGVVVGNVSIYRNGSATPFATVAASTTTVIDVGRISETLYFYTADYTTQGQWQRSALSDPQQALTAPRAPTLALVKSRATDITISIAPASGSSTAQFTQTYMYRDGISLFNYTGGALAEYVDGSVVPGRQYAYTARFFGVGIAGTVLESTDSALSRGSLSAIFLATASIPQAPVLSIDWITPSQVNISVRYPIDGSASVVTGTNLTRSGAGGAMTVFLAQNMTWFLDSGRIPGSSASYTAIFTTVWSPSNTSVALAVTHPAPDAPTQWQVVVEPPHTATRLSFNIVFPTDGNISLSSFIARVMVFRNGTALRTISTNGSRILAPCPSSASDSCAGVTFVDDGLPPGRAFPYSALVSTAHVNSSLSSPLVLSTQRPDAPSMQGSSTINSSAIAVFVAGVPPANFSAVGVGSLRLYRNSSLAVTVVPPNINSTLTTVVDSGLLPGRLYTYVSDYTTKSADGTVAGADSLLSSSIVAWTAPTAPVMSHLPGSASTLGVVVSITAPTDGSAGAIMSTTVQRAPLNETICTSDNATFTCSDASIVFLPGRSYTYHAFYAGQGNTVSAVASYSVPIPAFSNVVPNRGAADRSSVHLFAPSNSSWSFSSPVRNSAQVQLELWSNGDLLSVLGSQNASTGWFVWNFEREFFGSCKWQAVISKSAQSALSCGGACAVGCSSTSAGLQLVARIVDEPLMASNASVALWNPYIFNVTAVGLLDAEIAYYNRSISVTWSYVTNATMENRTNVRAWAALHSAESGETIANWTSVTATYSAAAGVAAAMWTVPTWLNTSVAGYRLRVRRYAVDLLGPDPSVWAESAEFVVREYRLFAGDAIVDNIASGVRVKWRLYGVLLEPLLIRLRYTNASSSSDLGLVSDSAVASLEYIDWPVALTAGLLPVPSFTTTALLDSLRAQYGAGQLEFVVSIPNTTASDVVLPVSQLYNPIVQNVSISNGYTATQILHGNNIIIRWEHLFAAGDPAAALNESATFDVRLYESPAEAPLVELLNISTSAPRSARLGLSWVVPVSVPRGQYFIRVSQIVAGAVSPAIFRDSAAFEVIPAVLNMTVLGKSSAQVATMHVFGIVAISWSWLGIIPSPGTLQLELWTANATGLIQRLVTVATALGNATKSFAWTPSSTVLPLPGPTSTTAMAAFYSPASLRLVLSATSDSLSVTTNRLALENPVISSVSLSGLYQDSLAYTNLNVTVQWSYTRPPTDTSTQARFTLALIDRNASSVVAVIASNVAASTPNATSTARYVWQVPFGFATDFYSVRVSLYNASAQASSDPIIFANSSSFFIQPGIILVSILRPQPNTSFNIFNPITVEWRVLGRLRGSKLVNVSARAALPGGPLGPEVPVGPAGSALIGDGVQRVAWRPGSRILPAPLSRPPPAPYNVTVTVVSLDESSLRGSANGTLGAPWAETVRSAPRVVGRVTFLVANDSWAVSWCWFSNASYADESLPSSLRWNIDAVPRPAPGGVAANATTRRLATGIAAAYADGVYSYTVRVPGDLGWGGKYVLRILRVEENTQDSQIWADTPEYEIRTDGYAVTVPQSCINIAQTIPLSWLVVGNPGGTVDLLLRNWSSQATSEPILFATSISATAGAGSYQWAPNRTRLLELSGAVPPRSAVDVFGTDGSIIVRSTSAPDLHFMEASICLRTSYISIPYTGVGMAVNYGGVAFLNSSRTAYWNSSDPEQSDGLGSRTRPVNTYLRFQGQGQQPVLLASNKSSPFNFTIPAGLLEGSYRLRFYLTSSDLSDDANVFADGLPFTLNGTGAEVDPLPLTADHIYDEWRAAGVTNLAVLSFRSYRLSTVAVELWNISGGGDPVLDPLSALYRHSLGGKVADIARGVQVQSGATALSFVPSLPPARALVVPSPRSASDLYVTSPAYIVVRSEDEPNVFSYNYAHLATPFIRSVAIDAPSGLQAGSAITIRWTLAMRGALGLPVNASFSVALMRRGRVYVTIASDVRTVVSGNEDYSLSTPFSIPANYPSDTYTILVSLLDRAGAADPAVYASSSSISITAQPAYTGNGPLDPDTSSQVACAASGLLVNTSSTMACTFLPRRVGAPSSPAMTADEFFLSVSLTGGTLLSGFARGLATQFGFAIAAGSQTGVFAIQVISTAGSVVASKPYAIYDVPDASSTMACLPTVIRRSEKQNCSIAFRRSGSPVFARLSESSLETAGSSIQPLGLADSYVNVFVVARPAGPATGRLASKLVLPAGNGELSVNTTVYEEPDATSSFVVNATAFTFATVNATSYMVIRRGSAFDATVFPRSNGEAVLANCSALEVTPSHFVDLEANPAIELGERSFVTVSNISRGDDPLGLGLCSSFTVTLQTTEAKSLPITTGLVGVRASLASGGRAAIFHLAVVASPDRGSSLTCAIKVMTASSSQQCTIVPRSEGEVVLVNIADFQPDPVVKNPLNIALIVRTTNVAGPSVAKLFDITITTGEVASVDSAPASVAIKLKADSKRLDASDSMTQLISVVGYGDSTSKLVCASPFVVANRDIDCTFSPRLRGEPVAAPPTNLQRPQTSGALGNATGYLLATNDPVPDFPFRVTGGPSAGMGRVSVSMVVSGGTLETAAEVQVVSEPDGTSLVICPSPDAPVFRRTPLEIELLPQYEGVSIPTVPWAFLGPTFGGAPLATGEIVAPSTVELPASSLLIRAFFNRTATGRVNVSVLLPGVSEPLFTCGVFLYDEPDARTSFLNCSASIVEAGTEPIDCWLRPRLKGESIHALPSVFTSLRVSAPERVAIAAGGEAVESLDLSLISSAPSKEFAFRAVLPGKSGPCTISAPLAGDSGVNATAVQFIVYAYLDPDAANVTCAFGAFAAVNRSLACKARPEKAGSGVWSRHGSLRVAVNFGDSASVDGRRLLGAATSVITLAPGVSDAFEFQLIPSFAGNFSITITVPAAGFQDTSTITARIVVQGLRTVCSSAKTPTKRDPSLDAVLGLREGQSEWLTLSAAISAGSAPTFTWLLGDESRSLRSRSSSQFRYNQPGTYVVVGRASNEVSAEERNCTVLVEQAIYGLRLATCGQGNAVAFKTPCNLTAFVEAGSNVRFRYRILESDTQSPEQTFDSAVAPWEAALPGKYTVAVRAYNSRYQLDDPETPEALVLVDVVPPRILSAFPSRSPAIGGVDVDIVGEFLSADRGLQCFFGIANSPVLADVFSLTRARCRTPPTEPTEPFTIPLVLGYDGVTFLEGAYNNFTIEGCPPGYYAITFDVPCNPCSQGSFSAGGRAPLCTLCPADFYQPFIGRPDCIDCPANAGTNKVEGVSLLSYCVCNPGYYGFAFDGRPCDACPREGSRCTRYNMTLPEAAAGYYISSANPTIAYSCEPPEACPGGIDSCTEGYAGPRCSSCLRSDAVVYYRLGAFCYRCPDGISASFVILCIILFIALFVIGVLFASVSQRRINDIGQLVRVSINMVQVLTVFSRMRLKWPPIFMTIINALSVFNLNIEWLRPECSVRGNSFLIKWLVTLTLPLALTLFGIFVWVLAVAWSPLGRKFKMFLKRKEVASGRRRLQTDNDDRMSISGYSDRSSRLERSSIADDSESADGDRLTDHMNVDAYGAPAETQDAKKHRSTKTVVLLWWEVKHALAPSTIKRAGQRAWTSMARAGRSFLAQLQRLALWLFTYSLHKESKDVLAPEVLAKTRRMRKRLRLQRMYEEVDLEEDDERKRRNRTAKELAILYVHALLLGASMAYVLLGQYALSTFACIPNTDGRFYLASEPSIECDKDGTWGKMIGAGIAGVLLYTIGIPVALLALAFYGLRTNKVRDQQFKDVCGFLVLQYRPKYPWWEVVILMRKLAIIINNLFLINRPVLQSIVAFVILFAATLVQISVKPYTIPRINRLESLSLMCTMFVLFGGLVFLNADVTDEVIVVVQILLLALLSVFGGMILYITLNTLRYGRARKARRKLQMRIGDFQLDSKTIEKIDSWFDGLQRRARKGHAGAERQRNLLYTYCARTARKARIYIAKGKAESGYLFNDDVSFVAHRILMERGQLFVPPSDECAETREVEVDEIKSLLENMREFMRLQHAVTRQLGGTVYSAGHRVKKAPKLRWIASGYLPTPSQLVTSAHARQDSYGSGLQLPPLIATLLSPFYRLKKWMGARVTQRVWDDPLEDRVAEAVDDPLLDDLREVALELRELEEDRLLGIDGLEEILKADVDISGAVDVEVEEGAVDDFAELATTNAGSAAVTVLGRLAGLLDELAEFPEDIFAVHPALVHMIVRSLRVLQKPLSVAAERLEKSAKAKSEAIKSGKNTSIVSIQRANSEAKTAKRAKRVLQKLKRRAANLKRFDAAEASDSDDSAFDADDVREEAVFAIDDPDLEVLEPATAPPRQAVGSGRASKTEDEDGDHGRNSKSRASSSKADGGVTPAPVATCGQTYATFIKNARKREKALRESRVVRTSRADSRGDGGEAWAASRNDETIRLPFVYEKDYIELTDDAPREGDEAARIELRNCTNELKLLSRSILPEGGTVPDAMLQADAARLSDALKLFRGIPAVTLQQNKRTACEAARALALLCHGLAAYDQEKDGGVALNLYRQTVPIYEEVCNYELGPLMDLLAISEREGRRKLVASILSTLTNIVAVSPSERARSRHLHAVLPRLLGVIASIPPANFAAERASTRAMRAKLELLASIIDNEVAPWMSAARGARKGPRWARPRRWLRELRDALEDAIWDMARLELVGICLDRPL